jgi:hypothetical protein
MRKGQAAMEFLMTYGWAILIVIAVIAALFAMGVFKLPTGGIAPCSPCFAPATGIAYKDHNRDNLVIINGRGNDIIITKVFIEETPYDIEDITVGANEAGTIYLPGSFSGDVRVTVEFQDLGTGLLHNATATLHGA